MAGRAFDAGSIEVKLNGAWPAATSANSFGYGNASGDYQCPRLSLSMSSPNNHWSGRIG